MFLLIPAGLVPYYCPHSFTFHNVSINTQNFQVTPAPDNCFTFHNVSINTDDCDYSKAETKYFTFHNVSINTVKRFDNRLCKFALHSTMFLLIPLTLPSVASDYLSLHSTMFLLIRFRRSAESGTGLSLHSTMFLLIRFTYYKDEKGGILYIPQCFY